MLLVCIFSIIILGIIIVKRPRTIIWMGRYIRNKLLLLLNHTKINMHIIINNIIIINNSVCLRHISSKKTIQRGITLMKIHITLK